MLIKSDFKPAFWLRGPHAQTLFASQARPMPRLTTQPERLELADGDFLDLAWLPEADLPAEAPLVVVLHGLNGSLESKYARGLLQQVQAHGARGVLLHFRGAARPNRLPHNYHSGETSDLRWLLALLRQRYPQAPLAAVGYSLGANVLLKYLGEQGRQTPLSCAVGVSVPFDIKICTYAMQRGFSRIYQNHLLKGLRAMVQAKIDQGIITRELPDLKQLMDFPSFDAAVTVPLHGFASAHDYYEQASCKPYLRDIRVPTLIIHSRDDPFMAPEIVPRADELSDAVLLELSEQGGHVGFVAANRYGSPVYWLEERIPAWLEQSLPGFTEQ